MAELWENLWNYETVDMYSIDETSVFFKLCREGRTTTGAKTVYFCASKINYVSLAQSHAYNDIRR